METRRTAIVIEEGDIAAAAVDAIVSPASTQLTLDSGAAAAIARAAGPAIREECARLAPIPLGHVAVTSGGDLPARHIVHAAGMEPAGAVDPSVLASLTRRVLEAADALGLASVALPAIGTGTGGLGMQECAQIMLAEAARYAGGLREIRFVLSGEPAYRMFEQVRDAERIRMQMERLRR